MLAKSCQKEPKVAFFGWFLGIHLQILLENANPAELGLFCLFLGCPPGPAGPPLPGPPGEGGQDPPSPSPPSTKTLLSSKSVQVLQPAYKCVEGMCGGSAGVCCGVRGEVWGTVGCVGVPFNEGQITSILFLKHAAGHSAAT